MQYADAVSRFLAQLVADGRSPHTVAQYARHLAALGRWLPPDAALAAVTPEELARFLGDPAVLARPDGARKRANTLNALRSALRAFFAYAARAGHVAQDPSRLVRRAICAPAPPRTLADEAVAKLIAALAAGTDPLERRDFALFHTMLATGVRLGTVVALDVGDVDLAAGELVVRHAKGDARACHSSAYQVHWQFGQAGPP